MTCPNCKEQNISRTICKKCGVNMPVSLKSIKISARFYNRALIKARSFELFEAISLLENSVKFDKKNIHAKNLLGLLYLEVGQPADAIKQWILSQSILKHDNLAISYLEIAEEQAKSLQNQDDSVKLYNEALFYIKENELTKALEYLNDAVNLNPKFIKAMNLISLINIKRRENASSYIDKVLSLDKTNETAVHYQKVTRKNKEPQNSFNTLEPRDLNQRPRGIKPKPPVSISYDEKSVKTRRGINFGNIFSFIIGSAAAASLIYFLLIPGITVELERDINSLGLELLSAVQEKEQLATENAQTIEELEIENAVLSNDLASLQARFTTYENAASVSQASELHALGDTEAAARILLNLDIDNIPFEMLQTAQNLREVTLISTSFSFYEQGRDYFMAGNYNDARNALEQSLLFATSEALHIDDTLYFLGRVFEIFGQYDTALESFYAIVEQHPTSNMMNQTLAAISRIEDSITIAIFNEMFPQNEDEE